MARGCALGDAGRAELCRNSAAASHLKLISIFTIFVTSVVGISSPVFLARLFHGKSAYDTALLIIKCFAAGVILSTSLVHVLPDAYEALADCQVSTRHPWRDFPFSGLVCLIGVLLALFVDVVDTSSHSHHADDGEKLKYERLEKINVDGKVEIGGERSCLGNRDEEGEDDLVAVIVEDEEERLAKEKQKMVSKVLEIGIIFHSVIIGVTMGIRRTSAPSDRSLLLSRFIRSSRGWGSAGVSLRFW